MDTICGVGLPELVLLALLGFVLIGPDNYQQMARNAGRLMYKIQRSPYFRDFSEMVKMIRDLPNTLVRMGEIDSTVNELQSTMNDIQQLMMDDPSQQTIPREKVTHIRQQLQTLNSGGQTRHIVDFNQEPEQVLEQLDQIIRTAKEEFVPSDNTIQPPPIQPSPPSRRIQPDEWWTDDQMTSEDDPWGVGIFPPASKDSDPSIEESDEADAD